MNRKLKDPNTHLDPRDKRKGHMELAMEIEELKIKKNRDMENIKMIKVELQKMDVLYKKYREALTTNPFLTTPSVGSVPFGITCVGDAEEVADTVSTEELLVETAKIKAVLQA